MKLVGIGLFIPCIAFSQAQTFQKDRCDFSVVFPIPYETKLIINGKDEGILATARPKKSVKLSAECWPRENISTRDFMRHIQNGVQSQGIEVTAVTAEQRSTGDVVTLVGRVNTPNQLIHLRIISHFGPKNRMDLRIIDYDLAGSKEQIDFRNSVRPTNQTAENSSKKNRSKYEKPPDLNSEGWTQESTKSKVIGPWLDYDPPGTRYSRIADGTIYRFFPPGIRPNAEKANPFSLDVSTDRPPSK